MTSEITIFLITTVLFHLAAEIDCQTNSSNNDISLLGTAVEAFSPCNDRVVFMSREIGRRPSEENYWTGNINLTDYKKYGEARIHIALDSEAVIKVDSEIARVYAQNLNFIITPYNVPDSLTFEVLAPQGRPFPNIKSVTINSRSVCKDPAKWSPTFIGVADTAVGTINSPRDFNAFCGRRQLAHSELVFGAAATKPGDWPWHAAVNRRIKTQWVYQCGGTLVSRAAIVTAAHCVTRARSRILVLSKKLLVQLGKYNLKGENPGLQERRVSVVYILEDYDPFLVRNDIAMVRLVSEVEYGLLIQPICLWPEEDLSKNSVFGSDGTVVGWGLNENLTLSEQLAAATVPVIPDFECLLSESEFFKRYLTNTTFCAGRRNGTSACNGDSGGSFVIPRTQADNKISYYLRGIVSLSVGLVGTNICDKSQYVLFTDSARYLDFINEHK